MAEFSSNAKGNTGVALGAVGTGLGALAAMNNGGGLLGGLFGGGGCNSQPINRYEAEQQATIARLEADIKFRDSTIYSNGLLNDLRNYVDNKLDNVHQQLAAQAVQNQRTADAFDMVRNDMMCCKQELYASIQRERDDRCCADNSIVNYVNAVFYPKMTADLTTGTTTTAQTVYNPLPRCGGCGCNG